MSVGSDGSTNSSTNSLAGSGHTLTGVGSGEQSFLEDYELGRTLGKGNFATVKLARRVSTGDTCALKVVEYKAVASARQAELFRREIAAMSTVNSPHVVRLRRFVPQANFPSEVRTAPFKMSAGGGGGGGRKKRAPV